MTNFINFFCSIY